MSYRTDSEVLPLGPYNKGLDTYSADLQVEDGFYPDAENMDLRTKTPNTIGGYVPVTTTPVPDGGTVIWAEVYRPGSNIHEELIYTSLGNAYAYNVDTGKYRKLRSDLSTSARYATSIQYRSERVIANGVDVPMRYDGTDLVQLGSQVVARFESGWTGGEIQSEEPFVHTGESSLRATFLEAGTFRTYADFESPKDFKTGLGGAPDFDVDDVFRLQMYVANPSVFSHVSNLSLSQEGIYTYSELHSNGTSLHYDLATKVNTGTAVSVGRIALNLRKIGSPTGTMTLSVMTSSGTGTAATPSGTTITNGTSEEVNMADVAAVDGWVTFTFATPPSLAANSVYWLVLGSTWTPSATNHIRWNVNYTPSNPFMAGNSEAAPTAWVNFAASGGGYTGTYRIYSFTSGFNLKFYTDAVTEASFSSAIAPELTAGWNVVSFRVGDFSSTGSPSWDSIVRVEISLNSTGASTVYFDDLVLAYNLSPRPAQIVANYQGSVLLADLPAVGSIPADRVKIIFSDVSQINYFPVENFIRVTGGSTGLEEEDRVSCMKVYASVVIVGKPRAIFSLSGAAGAFTLQPFTTEIGIDSHQGALEAPRAIFFPYGNGILGLRLTAKDTISMRIHPTLQDLDHTKIDLCVGIRHSETHTLRWSFLRKDGTRLQVWYDYFLDVWTSKITAYDVAHFHSGIRGTDRVVHFVNGTDGYIYAADVGETLNGSPLASTFTTQWKYRTAQSPNELAKITRWVGVTAYLGGTATSVKVYAKEANNPREIHTAEFKLLGSISPNTSGADAFVDCASRSRFLQVKFVCESGQFEVQAPSMLHFFDSPMPI